MLLTIFVLNMCCTDCSGLGYCFSAALPPYLTTAATGAIDKVEREGRELAAACTANARSLRGLLSDIPGARAPVCQCKCTASKLPGVWQDGGRSGTAAHVNLQGGTTALKIQSPTSI